MCKTADANRLQVKVNMFVVSLLQVPVGMYYVIVLSSIYQFVTSSTTISSDKVTWNGSLSMDTRNKSTQENHSNQLWSGLGQSDFFYAWVINGRGAGLLAGAILPGLLSFLSHFRFSVLLSSLIPLMSCLFYLTTIEGWMIVVAIFLQGFSIGLVPTMILSYVSVAAVFLERDSEKINDEQLEETKSERTKYNKRRGYSLRDKFLSMNLLCVTIGSPVGVGISSVMAQFEQTVDQLRWPGWVSGLIMLLYTGLFLVVYREVKIYDSHNETKKSLCTKRCCLLSNIQRHWSKVKFPSFVNVIVYIFLVFTRYVVSSLFTVIDAFVALVLSGHFGFTIAYISYFNFGLMVISFAAGFLQLSLKCLKLNNRIVLMVTLLMALIGGVMASDWQAVGQDPCQLNFKSYLNDSHFTISNEQIVLPAALDNFTIAIDLCIAGSTDTSGCYWNPNSRITGTHCSRCRPVCRSKSMSIHLAQFCLGVGLIQMAAIIGWVGVVGVATDSTPKNACTGIRLYSLFGEHTFGPFIVWNTTVLLSILGLIILYKPLGPISKIKVEKVNVDLTPIIE